jgi:hypothetical protein
LSKFAVLLWNWAEVKEVGCDLEELTPALFASTQPWMLMVSLE